jgi:cyclic lactone autoinducer peptide
MKKFYILLAVLVQMIVTMSTGFACIGATYEPKVRS